MQVAWPGIFGSHAEGERESQDARAALPFEVEVHVAAPCDAVRARLEDAFRARGWRVYPSFDLQAALERLPSCGCPYHGQDTCTCQYVVWHVYAAEEEPVLVLLHGRDEETWVTLSAANVQQSRVYHVVKKTIDDGRWTMDDRR